LALISKKNTQMKIVKYIVLSLVLTGFVFTSCSGFLEVTPVGKTPIPIFFSDIEGISAALPGSYSLVYKYYVSDFYKYPEVAGNMVDLNTVSTGDAMVSQYNFVSDPDEEAFAQGHIWRNGFSALANVNNILEYEPALRAKYPEYADTLQIIKAQALFLRALCHFDICRTYAQPYNYTADASHLGIPVLLKTPGSEDNIGRSSVKAVYAQILSDLLASELTFGNYPKKDVYHVSKNAVQALLSRVYLYMEDWDNVIKYSTYAINTTPLAKGSDYLKMYINQEAGTESIFRLNGLDQSGELGETFYKPDLAIAFSADTLMSLFEDTTDIRLKLFRTKSGSQKYATLKFYYEDKSIGESLRKYDPIILRVSEMYLNRAEAYLNKDELKKAADDVKQIIARSLGKDVSEIQISETNKAELARIIEKERTKELCFEGHQFFDITRKKQNLIRGSKTNSNVKSLTYPNDLFVLPIPQQELDANKNMMGNPTVNN
jgi:starch-binding outer membrane protein, SusD/RagB family